MKAFLFIIFALISLVFFSREKTNEIKVINFKSHYEGLRVHNEFFVVEDNIKIAFWKDMKMYIRSYINLHNDSGKFTLNGERDTTYSYYIFQKNVTSGFRYKNLNDENPVKYEIDSFLVENGINLGNFNPENYDLGKPLQIINRNRNEIIEKYIWDKKNPYEPDSIYRFYDKRFRDIDFSFSPKYDKMHKSKLTKMLFITNPKQKSNGFEADMPRLLKYREITVSSFSNPAEILSLFKRFDKAKKIRK